MTTLAPKLPWTHRYAPGYPNVGSQWLPTDPDTVDYLQRLYVADGNVGVEVGVAQAIDVFVRGCKSDNAGYSGDPTRTNWDALKACCIMAGARTISGALVPLKTPYGAELVDINALPTPTIDDGGYGTVSSWNAAARTISYTGTGTSGLFPHFSFPVGMVAGKRYRIRGRVSGGYVYGTTGFRLISGGSNIYADADGNFDGIMAGYGAGTLDSRFDGRKGPNSVTIESLSIREDSFTPTAQGGWTASDYSRGGSAPGLKGNGSSLYLDTNRAENADGQNDAHYSVYVASAAGSSLRNHIGSQYGWIGEDDTTTYFRRNQAASSATIASQNLTGFLGTSRGSASSLDYRGAGTTSSLSQASAAPSSTNTVLYRTHLGTQQSDARLSFYSIGSACDLAALDSRTTHLMNSIRFTLLTGLNPGDYDPATLAYLLAAYTAGGSLA